MDSSIRTSRNIGTCPVDSIIDSMSDLTLYMCPSWLDETVREFREYKEDCNANPNKHVCTTDTTRILFANIDRRLGQNFHKYMLSLPNEILFINNRAKIMPLRVERLRRFFLQPEYRHTRYLLFILVRDNTRPLEIEIAKETAIEYIRRSRNGRPRIIWDFPFHMGDRSYKEFLGDLLVHVRPNFPNESTSDIAVLIVRTDCNLVQKSTGLATPSEDQN